MIYHRAPHDLVPLCLSICLSVCLSVCLSDLSTRFALFAAQHAALQEAAPTAKVIRAFDINDIANKGA